MEMAINHQHHSTPDTNSLCQLVTNTPDNKSNATRNYMMIL